MRQLSRIMSTYSPDVSGVCSALYELGGMVVMHDASGCNSTYTTFDEPRWYDVDSMIFVSGLEETDAILGNDEKLITDIVKAAVELKPKFIAVAGGPVPMLIGTDFAGIAEVVEKRTGIPTFGFFTNGTNFYCFGAGMALEAVAKRFCPSMDLNTAVHPTEKAVNLIGATPLDFSIKGNIPLLRALFESRGYSIISLWAMDSRLEDLTRAGQAAVNVVVSACGLPAARCLRDKYGTPFVAGIPIGRGTANELFRLVDQAAADGTNQVLQCGTGGRVDSRSGGDDSLQRDMKTLIIGEQVYANSLRYCLRADYGLSNVRTLCPLSPDPSLLLPGDSTAAAESEIEMALAQADLIVADPLYRQLLPAASEKCFIDMPHEAFSGRIYRSENPCMIGDAIDGHLRKFFALESFRKYQIKSVRSELL